MSVADDLAAARQMAAAWCAGPVAVSPFGDGHINATWLVTADGQRGVLQRLSDAVFPDPAGVMAKVARVVDHLAGSPGVPLAALLATRDGERWRQDATGGVWRMWQQVPGARAPQRFATVAEAQAGAAAFGRFQRAVADLPGPVDDPISGFLQLAGYLQALDAALAVASPDAAATDLLAVIERQRGAAGDFSARDRLVHGDCKVDNLLFRDDADEVVAVIDLDTVMRGHWAWDFGDLARSALAGDDDVDVACFAGLAAGFVGSGALDDGRTPQPGSAELAEQLVVAPRHVALMLGVRFLTDHLCGDVYFRVRQRGDNLHRARRQLTVLANMERHERAMLAAARRA